MFSPSIAYKWGIQESKYINIHGKNAYDIHDSNNDKPSVWAMGMFISLCLYFDFYEINLLKLKEKWEKFKRKKIKSLVHITVVFFIFFLKSMVQGLFWNANHKFWPTSAWLI